MAHVYSAYEAKAQFSEVIRQVRRGRIVTLTYRGEPVAEIRPIERRQIPTLDELLSEFERNGTLVRPALPRQAFRPVERRPGALSRFLAGRGE